MQLRKLAAETFLEQAANFTLMLGSSCKRTFDSNFVHGSHFGLDRLSPLHGCSLRKPLASRVGHCITPVHTCFYPGGRGFDKGNIVDENLGNLDNVTSW